MLVINLEVWHPMSCTLYWRKICWSGHLVEYSFSFIEAVSSGVIESLFRVCIVTTKISRPWCCKICLCGGWTLLTYLFFVSFGFHSSGIVNLVVGGISWLHLKGPYIHDLIWSMAETNILINYIYTCISDIYNDLMFYILYQQRILYSDWLK